MSPKPSKPASGKLAANAAATPSKIPTPPTSVVTAMETSDGGAASEVTTPPPAETEVAPVTMQDMIARLSELLAESTKMLAVISKMAGGSRKKTVAGGARSIALKKPLALSPELLKFLGLPEGSTLSRPDVTRSIGEYIRKNELYNPEDKREIVPNAELKALMTPPDGQWPAKITYFNLQSLIKHHMSKAPEEEAAEPKPASTP